MLERNWTFLGKEWDADESLYYFWARYFDPHVDVWQSPDPTTATPAPPVATPRQDSRTIRKNGRRPTEGRGREIRRPDAIRTFHTRSRSMGVVATIWRISSPSRVRSMSNSTRTRATSRDGDRRAVAAEEARRRRRQPHHHQPRQRPRLSKSRDTRAARFRPCRFDIEAAEYYGVFTIGKRWD